MKTLISIAVILSFSVLAQNEKRTVTIDRNNQGGFNIHSNSGELLNEYTKNNCDSTTLETLNDIFFEGDSLKDKITKVEIVNLPEKSILESPIVTVVIGVFFGWLFSFLSQKFLNKQQFKLQQKKDWLNEFIKSVSEFSTISTFFGTELLLLIKYNSSNDSDSLERLVKLSDECISKIPIITYALDVNDESHKKVHEELNNLMSVYLEAIHNIKLNTGDYDVLIKIIDAKNLSIVRLTDEIIRKKQKELNNL